MLYESTLVGAFNYLWGYSDAKSNRPSTPALISNAQNPIDSLLGDLIGNVGGRYFLIEFKQLRNGFFDEVHSASAKASRTALYAHIRHDPMCRELARTGHFAAWAAADNLIFAPYAHTVGRGSFDNGYVHELDHPSYEIYFEAFYAKICTTNLDPFYMENLVYAHGLGISAAGMHKYLECILAAVPRVVNPSAEANALFGFWNPTNSGLVAVPTSFDGLLSTFAAYKRLASMPPTRGMKP